MEDFKWNKKENYTDEDIKEILNQHRNVVYAKGKAETQKEYETKLKEYEAKENQYEEEKLFSSIKNDKQKSAIKSLMNTDNYKSLSKEEAFKKVTEDYKDIFKFEEEKKDEIKNNIPDIGKTLLDLHAVTDSSTKLEELETKAKIKGITDKKELETYIVMAKANALKNIKK